MVQSFDNNCFPNFYNVKEFDHVADCFKEFRASFQGILIGNNQLTFETASVVATKAVDCVSFGRAFLANPD